jgi:hypothetical protein
LLISLESVKLPRVLRSVLDKVLGGDPP